MIQLEKEAGVASKGLKAHIVIVCYHKYQRKRQTSDLCEIVIALMKERWGCMLHLAKFKMIQDMKKLSK